MASSPICQAVLFQVVVIVFEQFLVAAFGDAEQLNLHLERCLAVGESLGDVLFDGACGLYHLIDGAVAVSGQEPFAERLGELHQHIALAIEEEVGIDGFLAQHTGRTIIVALEWNVSGVGHGGSYQVVSC